MERDFERDDDAKRFRRLRKALCEQDEALREKFAGCFETFDEHMHEGIPTPEQVNTVFDTLLDAIDRIRKEHNET